MVRGFEDEDFGLFGSFEIGALISRIGIEGAIIL